MNEAKYAELNEKKDKPLLNKNFLRPNDRSKKSQKGIFKNL